MPTAQMSARSERDAQKGCQGLRPLRSTVKQPGGSTEQLVGPQLLSVALLQAVVPANLCSVGALRAGGGVMEEGKANVAACTLL